MWSPIISSSPLGWSFSPGTRLLGFRLLVGLFGRVVLPHRRLGRGHHDHGSSLRGLGLVDRLFDSLLLLFRKIPDDLFCGRGFLVFGEGWGGDAQDDEPNERVANESCRCHLPASYELNVSAW